MGCGVIFFWVQIRCFEENNAEILFNLLINNSCDGCRSSYCGIFNSSSSTLVATIS